MSKPKPRPRGRAPRLAEAHPLQPFVWDGDVLRFKENALVSHLLDVSTERGYSLNDLALIPFPDEDCQQFAQLIGYSLSGYGDLSYVSDEAFARAERKAARLRRAK